ncbi:MAG: DUF1249 domain-containing protein [Gammaproteobacteria bacterium]|nr:DUF1249 domain-containing protein [Gammaproteobacteria bacterium]MDH3767419.1 DUF1249 domain-containing protein [Gammaproteobacteria bacterium]
MTLQRSIERQTDSVVVLPKPARPVSFAGLMTLYESNFIRLGWLLPEFPPAGTSLVSRVPADIPLFLRVEKIERYTTTVTLTYYFKDGLTPIADPDLQVRLYHDACLAEAMACTDNHRHAALQPFATGNGTELQRRWNRNMMLNKWLEYCADQGHSFEDG